MGFGTDGNVRALKMLASDDGEETRRLKQNGPLSSLETVPSTSRLMPPEPLRDASTLIFMS